jgi:hypothetical protein
MDSTTDFQMVLVKWADAHAYEGGAWVYAHDIEDTGEYIVQSLGWMLTEDNGAFKEHISLAQSWGADDAIDHIINIPKGMVRSIQFLQSFTKEILV